MPVGGAMPSHDHASCIQPCPPAALPLPNRWTRAALRGWSRSRTRWSTCRAGAPWARSMCSWHSRQLVQLRGVPLPGRGCEAAERELHRSPTEGRIALVASEELYSGICNQYLYHTDIDSMLFDCSCKVVFSYCSGVTGFVSTGERERRQGRLLTWLAPQPRRVRRSRGHWSKLFGLSCSDQAAASPLWRCPDRASPDARPQPPNNLSTCQALINWLLVPIAYLQAPHVLCRRARALGLPSRPAPAPFGGRRYDGGQRACC